MSVVLICTLGFYLYVRIAPDTRIVRERIVRQRTLHDRINILSLPSLQRIVTQEINRIRTMSETVQDGDF